MMDQLERIFLLLISSLLISHRFVGSKSVLREKRGLSEAGDVVDPTCINWCETGLGLCNNDKICVFDASNCSVSCRLNQMEATPITFNSTENFTTTTATDKRSCGERLECVNGICDIDSKILGSPRCICDAGYTGVACTVKICFSICDVAVICQNEGTCIHNQTSCQDSCECKAGFSGLYCQQKVMDSSRSPSTRHQTTTEITLTGTTDDTACGGIFPCGPNGVCDKEEYEKTKELTCICNTGFVGNPCNKCEKYCGPPERGKCQYLKNDTEICNCNYPYTGDGCKVIRKFDEADWVWWVVGSCSALMVILMVLLIAVPYWMWRRREVFVMKVVYYFQPYEDDDGKLFDAFVSYKSSEEDEKFVLKTLYPKLEKELDFKLCLHQRDFLPGETIANNIIWAVENSRRTILVLSPNFLKSEFTRFEYQKAQHEMLKLKHKIIPIILEDISSDRDTMDGTLKTILESITYLEWPHAPNEKSLKKFWKRLELSLPKKRLNERSEDSNDSKTSCAEIYTKLDSGLPSTAVELNITDEEKSIQKTENEGVSFITDSDEQDVDKKNECMFNNAFSTIVEITETSPHASQKRHRTTRNVIALTETSLHPSPNVNDDIKLFFQKPENDVISETLKAVAAQYQRQLDLSSNIEDTKA